MEGVSSVRADESVMSQAESRGATAVTLAHFLWSNIVYVLIYDKITFRDLKLIGASK